jgi:hypothetical protein
MTLEIYYNDLTPEAQQRYLDFFDLESAKGGNLDINLIPIFMLDNADLDWRTE